MKFGHHPDPACDFCVEVEEIEAMVTNRRIGFDPEPTLDGRIERAMMFRVGGDQIAINAKAILREIEKAIRSPQTEPLYDPRQAQGYPSKDEQ